MVLAAAVALVALRLGRGLALVGVMALGLRLGGRFALATATGDGGGRVDRVGGELVENADLHILLFFLWFCATGL